MTNDDVLRLIGRIVVDSEAAGIRVRELEAELARKTKQRTNVVKMQPKAAEDPPKAAPPEVAQVATDPVPNQ